MLQIYGFINRHHLMRKFDISMPQASMDIRAYMKAHPDAMIYDLSQKQYVKKTTSDAQGRAASDGMM